MEEQKSPTSQMLEHIRDENNQLRQEKRSCIINNRRGILNNINKYSKTIKKSQLIDLANRVKHKELTTEDDLKLLNHAFIQDETNIKDFIKVDGALRGLTRELIGSRYKLKLAATECFVNLSLGSNACCLKIAKAASVYLMVNSKGMNADLQATSIWALGNLLGSDLKTWKHLDPDDLLLHLLNSLSVPDLLERVLYALINYVKIGFNEISPEQMCKIAQATLEIKTNDVEIESSKVWLLFLLSCSNNCDIYLSQETSFLMSILRDSDKYSIKTVTGSIRCLANLVSSEEGQIAGLVLKDGELFDQVCRNLNTVTESYPHLTNEICWLIGNLIYHPQVSVQRMVMNTIQMKPETKRVLNSYAVSLKI